MKKAIKTAMALVCTMPVCAMAQNATIGDMMFEPDLGPVTLRYQDGKTGISGEGQMAVKEYKSDFESGSRYNRFSVKALDEYVFIPDSMTFTLRLDADLTWFNVECLGWSESPDGPSEVHGNVSLDAKELLTRLEADPRVFGHYVFSRVEQQPIFDVIFSCDQAAYAFQDFVLYGHTAEFLTGSEMSGYKAEGDCVTGIETLRQDAAPARLYDLQGRRVAVPEAGRIYIRGRR